MLIYRITELLKSSLLLGGLLLCFCGAASVPIALRDTIIIDGEVVEVEVRDKKVDTDSLQREAKSDLCKLPHPWNIALATGIGTELGRCSWTNAAGSDWKAIDQFLGTNAYFKFSPRLGAEATAMANKHWGVRLGLYYTALRYEYSSLDQNGLEPDSMRFKFSASGNQLLQYYKYNVGIGVESDTSTVRIIDHSYYASMLEVPLGVRWFPQGNDARWAWFVDVGVAWRHRLTLPTLAQADVLNANGQYRRTAIAPGDMRRDFFIPQCRAGIQLATGKSWRWEAQVGAIASRAVSINRNDLFQITTTGWFVQIGCCKYLVW
jgi:hypothetical protein